MLLIGALTTKKNTQKLTVNFLKKKDVQSQ